MFSQLVSDCPKGMLCYMKSVLFHSIKNDLTQNTTLVRGVLFRQREFFASHRLLCKW